MNMISIAHFNIPVYSYTTDNISLLRDHLKQLQLKILNNEFDSKFLEATYTNIPPESFHKYNIDFYFRYEYREGGENEDLIANYIKNLFNFLDDVSDQCFPQIEYVHIQFPEVPLIEPTRISSEYLELNRSLYPVYDIINFEEQCANSINLIEFVNLFLTKTFGEN